MIDEDEPILEKAIGYGVHFTWCYYVICFHCLQSWWKGLAWCWLRFCLFFFNRTEIEWYPGKCLTQKVLKKKPKKGSKNAKPITKTESCESFFNFFKPPEVPEDDADIDEDLVWWQSFSINLRLKINMKLLYIAIITEFFQQAEELQNQMEQDYDIGYA